MKKKDNVTELPGNVGEGSKDVIKVAPEVIIKVRSAQAQLNGAKIDYATLAVQAEDLLGRALNKITVLQTDVNNALKNLSVDIKKELKGRTIVNVDADKGLVYCK